MRPVAILAGGPSVTAEVVRDVRAHNVRSVVINNSWLLMPDAECLFASDSNWWLARNPRISPTLEEFPGERLHCMRFRDIEGVTFVTPHPIPAGSNSALQAARYEAKRGAELILLFGVDLRDDQLVHHYGPHGNGLHNPSKLHFRRARAAWEAYANEPHRPTIINCSPCSALTCFPKMTMEEALGHVP